MNYFRFIFEPLKSNMYIFLKNDKALIIDPHRSDDAYKILKKNNVQSLVIILTHEHFDHISGVNFYKQNFQTIVIAQKFTQKRISNPKNKIATFYASSFIGKSKEILELVKEQCKENVCIGVDICIDSEYDLVWENFCLNIKSTPGHSKGSVCIIMDNYLFTGDSLIPNEKTITKFPGGSENEFLEITIPFLKSLDKNLTVLPGHGDACKLGDIL